MAERRRIVTLSSTGTVAVLKDLEDLTTFYTAKNTFTVKAPDRQTAYGQNSRRYGGQRAVSEAHGNGAITFQTIVKGTSTDQILANCGGLLNLLEQGRTDLFFEWRPDGATYSTYYEIRGPATWNPTYQWGQVMGAKAMPVDFTIPVAPLARGDYQTITVGALTLPVTSAVVIPGEAPALVNVAMTHSGGAAIPLWAMIGWYAQQSAPTLGAGQFTPAGVMNAESASNLITWTVTADATYLGGSGLKNTSGGGGIANFDLVGAMIKPDDWAAGTGIDLWARVQMSSTLVTPKMQAWVQGTNVNQVQYSLPYGSSGHLLIPPVSGTQFRFVHLGTIMLPDPSQTTTLRVQAITGAGSSGTFGLDYLIATPTRSTALGPTGFANDASYPDFLSTTSSRTKTIRADLSGLTNGGPDTGLGGSPIEMEPGFVNVIIKYSSLVPDDPTIDATSEQLSHALTACSLGVWPRYYLARGS